MLDSHQTAPQERQACNTTSTAGEAAAASACEATSLRLLQDSAHVRTGRPRARNNTERLRKLIAFAKLSPKAVAVLTRQPSSRSSSRSSPRFATARQQRPSTPFRSLSRDPETTLSRPAENSLDCFSDHETGSPLTSDALENLRRRTQEHSFCGPTRATITASKLDSRRSLPLHSSSQQLHVELPAQEPRTRQREATSAWAAQLSIPQALHSDSNQSPALNEWTPTLSQEQQQYHTSHTYNLSMYNPHSMPPAHDNQQHSAARTSSRDIVSTSSSSSSPRRASTVHRTRPRGSTVLPVHSTKLRGKSLHLMSPWKAQGERSRTCSSGGSTMDAPRGPIHLNGSDTGNHATSSTPADGCYPGASLLSSDRSLSLELKPAVTSSARGQHRRQSDSDTPCPSACIPPPSPPTLAAGSRPRSGGKAPLQSPFDCPSVPGSTRYLTVADWAIACAEGRRADEPDLIADWTAPRPARRTRAASLRSHADTRATSLGAELDSAGQTASMHTDAASGTSSGSQIEGQGSGSSDGANNLAFTDCNCNILSTSIAGLGPKTAPPPPPPGRRDNRGPVVEHKDRQLQQGDFELVLGSRNLVLPLVDRPSSTDMEADSDAQPGCPGAVQSNSAACGASPTRGNASARRRISPDAVSCGMLSLVKRAVSKLCESLCGPR